MKPIKSECGLQNDGTTIWNGRKLIHPIDNAGINKRNKNSLVENYQAHALQSFKLHLNLLFKINESKYEFPSQTHLPRIVPENLKDRQHE